MDSEGKSGDDVEFLEHHVAQVETEDLFDMDEDDMLDTDDDEEEEAEDEDKDEKRKFRCTDCKAAFRKKVTLKYHKTIHVDEAFYACEFCPATEIHWSELYLHQCIIPTAYPTLQCPECEKTVSTKKQLQVHEEVHALQRRFTTKRLDHYFKRKLNESEDKPVADWTAKPFLCGVCGKLFNKLYEVEYHEKLHNLERPPPNECVKCGIRYVNKQDLTKHTARGCITETTRKTRPVPSATNST